MPVLSIKSFGGIAPKVPARLLQDTQAQVAINCPVFNGSLLPLANVGSSLYTLTKQGVPKTIYRFGQDTDSDVSYWFHWTKDVDVCRGQIAGDTSEWTFFTGDGGPRATYNALALAQGNYPSVSRPLGLAAPTQACSPLANAFDPDEYPAEIYLYSSHWAQMSTSYGIMVSTTTDDDASYTTVTLGGTGMSDIMVALNTSGLPITAESVDNSIKVYGDDLGVDARLFIKYQTGVEANTGSANFTYLSSPNASATGTTDTQAFLVVQDGEIGSISFGDVVEVYTSEATNATPVASVTASGSYTASSLAAALSIEIAGKLSVEAKGSCLLLRPGTEASGPAGYIRYARKTPVYNLLGEAQAETTTATTIVAQGSEAAGSAVMIITNADIAAARGKHIEVVVNGGDPSYIEIPTAFTLASLNLLGAYGLTVTTYGSIEPFAVVRSVATGANATFTIRGGSYSDTPVYAKLSAEGYIDEDLTSETRIYTWTWVNKESGYEFESAPAPASGSVEVKTGQTVSVTGLQDVPTGEYVVTHRRIYRSTAGIYLFVAEIPAASTSYIDAIEPEALAEEMPSTNWAEPPADLAGLINLPNGMMAGFVGRDVYFCDPYHPHAWPENYIQTIDYPVVGLGRMDTTLAVLTKGTPYFIQGTHPDAMAVVKADIQQACVSKRSIVSHGGAVFYAAPDGLMRLAPGGSQIVTQNYFSFKQWQSYFKPESIHAYQHDNQYIAFYDNGITRGGFIFDMVSGQFILHNIYAEAGFQDPQRDKLFLAFDDRTIHAWGQGPTLNYVWRSKKFTMPKPLSFGWAQLEAEAYPMTLTCYADGEVVHSQTVTSRNPFRLPVKVGRDWEMQVDGGTEVFSIALAHSASELRDA
jgi:hypothetical protein